MNTLDKLFAQNWIESYKENYRIYGESDYVSDVFSDDFDWDRVLGPFGELNWDMFNMRGGFGRPELLPL